MNDNTVNNGNDNLVSRLMAVRLVTDTSQKTGNEYTYLELTWHKHDGSTYKQRAFFQGSDWVEIVSSLTAPIPGSNAL